MADYEDLFRGAARLGMAVAGLEVPWEHTLPFVNSFSEELKEYQELSVDAETGVLGIMTRGKGQSFAHRVARMMEVNGVDEIGLRRFLARARYFEYRNLFFKVELGKRGAQEFSYYFRRRPGIEVGKAWLEELGMLPGETDLLDRLATTLNKWTIHFLAAAVDIDGKRTDKVYFSQPKVPASWDRMRDAAAVAGVAPETWEPLDEHRDHFETRDLYLSVGFRDGKAVPGAKLDVHDVDVHVVDALMAAAGAGLEARARPRLLSDIHRGDVYDYVGLRLRNDAPVYVKAYCYRPSE